MVARAMGLVFGFITLMPLLAQEYYNRQPTASERMKIAGVTDYIQDGLRANFTQYFPGEAEQYQLVASNNVVAFTSAGALSNVVVLMPNLTNSPRYVVRLLAVGNISMKISNTFGATVLTYTNTYAATYSTPTNRGVTVYGIYPTNWFIDQDLP